MCTNKIPEEGIGMNVLLWQRHTLQDAAVYEGAFTPLIPADGADNVSLFF